MPAASSKALSPMAPATSRSQVARSRPTSSVGRSGPPGQRGHQPAGHVAPRGGESPGHKLAARRSARWPPTARDSGRAPGTTRGRLPLTCTTSPPERLTTSLPRTARRSAPINPAPAPNGISPESRIFRASVGWASAQGQIGRDLRRAGAWTVHARAEPGRGAHWSHRRPRGSAGSSAGCAGGRAEPGRLGHDEALDERRRQRQLGSQLHAERARRRFRRVLPAAKSRALARTVLAGAAVVTTFLAKSATSVPSDAGCQRAMTRATSFEVTLYVY